MNRPVGTTNLFVVPESRRVRLYRVDAVGNNLDAVLRWCSTHMEPVWVFDDGSFECPYDRVVQVYSDDHELIDGPWEVQP